MYNYINHLNRISIGCFSLSVMSTCVMYSNLVYFFEEMIQHFSDNNIYIDLSHISCLPDDIMIYQQEYKKEYDKKNTHIKHSISLCGGGFKIFYQLGIHKSLRTLQPKIENKMNYIGSSLGSFMAVLFTSKVNLDKNIIPELFRISMLFRHEPYYHLSQIGNMITFICNKYLPDNIHEIVSERCHITIAYFTPSGFKKKIISIFYSKQDLIDCIIASQYIPIWTDIKLHRFRGHLCIDSAFLDNHPILNENTVTVKCTEKGDISLTNKYNLSTFYPADQCTIENCIAEGCRDMIEFLKTDMAYKKWNIKIEP